MYHLTTKPIQRSKGRTATASSAYRAGAKLEDKRTGITHDYTKRSGVVLSDCFVVKDDKKVKLDRSQLWNKAEQTEKRKDSRTAREVVVNIPHVLSEQQRHELVDTFAQKLSKQHGCGVDYAIHLPDKEGDQRNHHAHIMLTTRSVELGNDGIQLGNKTELELSNRKLKELGKLRTQDQIVELRKDWADHTNNLLEKGGYELRIDHRSHKDRGLLEKPTIKLGWEATQLERQGIRTAKGDINRQIRADNEQMKELQTSITALQNAKAGIAKQKQQQQDITKGKASFKDGFEAFKQQRQQQLEQERQQQLERPSKDKGRGFER